MADEQQAGNSETDNDAESSTEGFVSRMTSYYVGMGSPNVPFPYVHYIPDGQEHDDDNNSHGEVQSQDLPNDTSSSGDNTSAEGDLSSSSEESTSLFEPGIYVISSDGVIHGIVEPPGVVQPPILVQHVAQHLGVNHDQIDPRILEEGDVDGVLVDSEIDSDMSIYAPSSRMSDISASSCDVVSEFSPEPSGFHQIFRMCCCVKRRRIS